MKFHQKAFKEMPVFRLSISQSFTFFLQLRTTVFNEVEVARSAMTDPIHFYDPDCKNAALGAINFFIGSLSVRPLILLTSTVAQKRPHVLQDPFFVYRPPQSRDRSRQERKIRKGPSLSSFPTSSVCRNISPSRES